MSKTTIDRIRGHELFSGCRRSELREIDRLGCTIDVAARRVLCREGSSAREFFVLAHGVADVATATGAWSRLHPGAWFGETALLRGGRRRATVCTVTAATVIVYGRQEFDTLLTIAPTVAARLEHTATMVTQSRRPTGWSWYQEIRSPRVGSALVEI